MRLKIGDRIYDWIDGDIGIIIKEHYDNKHPDFQDGWWIFWETGEFAGESLWISECEITLAENIE